MFTRVSPVLLVLCGLGLCSLSRAICEEPNKSIDPEQFAGITFDYLIVGGGTSGIALSSRLSEDPTSVVGVLEAGDIRLNDPMIDTPGLSGVGNASYDWNFATVPQTSAGSRRIPVPRGKLLGGSSGINGFAWGRASSAEYDAWATIARDKTWTWRALLPYMQKSERFSRLPSNPYPGITNLEAQRASVDILRVDGFTGPIVASYNTEYFNVSLEMVQTLNHLGVQTNAAPQAGHNAGVFNSLLSIDRSEGVRSYAATTYYCSHAHLRNHVVLPRAQVTRILLDQRLGGSVATGVEFIAGGRRFTAKVRKEIILAAGAVQTPQLLELSGIGNREILQRHGIRTLVNLPGVGENLQEHLFVIAQWKLNPGVDTFDVLRNNATVATEQAQVYSKNRTGLLAAIDSTMAFLPMKNVVSQQRLQELLHIFDRESRTTGIHNQQSQLERRWLESGQVPWVELIHWSKGTINPVQGENYVDLLGGIVHPTSRGSVHISSNDPLASPAIDTQFLNTTLDTQVLLDVLKYMLKVGKTEPFAGFVAAQTSPDPAAQSDDELLHSADIRGTAAMAPRELNGVVDASLKVYGTKNLRVVDASMFPFLIAAHTQATVYAVAEKLASEIKRGL
ncbi:alcohol oxidase [Earliella scabrosa]|nr:alcohol oxidase [Earliella scabrosa]